MRLVIYNSRFVNIYLVNIKFIIILGDQDSTALKLQKLLEVRHNLDLAFFLIFFFLSGRICHYS